MNQLVNNSKPKSPCQNCVPPERFVGCHSVCPEYKKFRLESDKKAMEVLEKKMKANAYDAYKKDKFKSYTRSK